MTSEVEAFRASAARFCSVVERIDGVAREESSGVLHQALAEVYADAARLTPYFSDAGEPPDISWNAVEEDARRLLLSALGSEGYSFVFDPWNDIEVLENTLASDLAEVYADLRAVLADDRGEAGAWDWRLAFDQHWGRHAAQALHALHWRAGSVPSW